MISERDQAVIWHPYTQQQTSDAPISIIKAQGTYLYAEDGKRYIDAVSSWWVNIHGHAHPYIAQAIAAQTATLEHVMFAGFTHKPAVELAERLLQHLSLNQQKVFYSDNGSTAVEVAMKMAFQYWYNRKEARTQIIAFKNAYHGDTFGAMSVSGRSAFTAPFLPFLFDVIYIDWPEPGSEQIVETQLLQIIQQHTVKEHCKIAAFIYEPLVQGTAGMQMCSPAIMDKLLMLCKKNSIITIADEVMTGFGRTGKMFASDYITEKPDIVCLSKGITGGFMAMGVTTCTQQVYEAFLSGDKMKTLFHGHSYTANPITCAAALASLDLMEQPATFENIHRISQKHQQFKDKLIHKGFKLRIRQQATILALEVQTAENASYFSNLRDDMYRFFINKGIVLRPLGNILYIMPPYCISDDDLDCVYASITEFFEKAL